MTRRWVASTGAGGAASELTRGLPAAARLPAAVARCHYSDLISACTALPLCCLTGHLMMVVRRCLRPGRFSWVSCELPHLTLLVLCLSGRLRSVDARVGRHMVGDV